MWCVDMTVLACNVLYHNTGSGMQAHCLHMPCMYASTCTLPGCNDMQIWTTLSPMNCSGVPAFVQHVLDGVCRALSNHALLV